MALPPTQAGSVFKTTDAGSYDDAAESFDRLSLTYSTGFATELVRIAQVRKGDRVLDLGVGTGIAARQLSLCGARCIGADLSEGMLRRAVQSSPALAMLRMDAEAFAIQPRSLDAIVSLFALLHFPHTSSVLSACREALKPGGVVAFAFGAPAPWSKAAARLPTVFTDAVKQRIGRLQAAPGALTQFLDERMGAAVSPTETPLAGRGRRISADLVRLTRDSGFDEIQSGWLGQRFTITSPEEFWELQSVFSSNARKRLANLDEQTRTKLRQEFIEINRALLNRGGSMIYEVGAGWIRAVRSR